MGRGVKGCTGEVTDMAAAGTPCGACRHRLPERASGGTTKGTGGSVNAFPQVFWGQWPNSLMPAHQPELGILMVPPGYVS